MIYITHPDIKTAKEITNHLLEKRLIACANFIPIESTYIWKEKINNEHEIVSIVKTRKELWQNIIAEVEKIHPYEVPCITKIEVESNPAYESWIKNITSS